MDLYNIPGDTGKTWRVDKFLDYAIGAPTICHPTIIEYGRRANWDVSTMMNANEKNVLETYFINGGNTKDFNVLTALSECESSLELKIFLAYTAPVKPSIAM